MSARRLQRPTPIKTSEYKWLSTSLVTSLAVLPHGSSDLPERNLQSQSEPSAGQDDRVFAARNQIKLSAEHSDEGACGSNITTSPPIDLSVDESPDRFLAAGNILATFDGTHMPVFMRDETRTDCPNVPAVQKILKAYEEGDPTEALIKANFPGGDFEYHLMAYLRNSMRIPSYRASQGSLEKRLLDAYNTGVKEWCAAALDVFISQVERNLTTHVESSEAADGRQGRKPVLWTQQFFLEETASQPALKSLGERTYKNSLEWWTRWKRYQREHEMTSYVRPASLMLAGEADAIHMQEELRFSSGLLRNISPTCFRCVARGIAHTLKSYGAPSQLVSLLLNMCLCPEDVAEYRRVESSAQGVSTASPSERVDIPRDDTHITQPLNVLDTLRIDSVFALPFLPPFLQSGYEANNFKTEAINKMIELYNSEEYDKALSVMDQEFHEPKEFHEHFFGLLRTAMRSYVQSSDGSMDSAGCNPHDLGKPLKELLHRYTKGLQMWCADVHGALAEKLEDAITAAHQSDTKESKNLIKWVSEMEPTYTQSVKWFKHQIGLSSVNTGQSPAPDTQLTFPPPVAQMRDNSYTLTWLIRNMPFDCFLFSRTNLASLVREVDRERNFSFLANLLETLSFTEDDIDGYKQYYHEMLRLVSAQMRQEDFEELKIDLKQDLSLQV
eukprot:Blabericola_migrator_1__3587@NODE_2068_length_3332_cov_11_108116_g1310_i0_p1_GENE_NODE_2068_length_3332_cov_11_108116_g1310_i0NODE_2068_length_3332_cov_11_108116_g1310_i0_p1_ORF_typecomplete_len670_score94_67DUF3196/PF11428_8/80DUF3196/PF11428_8/0_54DED/PF01335_21/4_9e02DED/PF01335_21/2_1_NODE_2068_length_3332_cov_11_108116_g1310_i04172426